MTLKRLLVQSVACLLLIMIYCKAQVQDNGDDLLTDEYWVAKMMIAESRSLLDQLDVENKPDLIKLRNELDEYEHKLTHGKVGKDTIDLMDFDVKIFLAESLEAFCIEMDCEKLIGAALEDVEIDTIYVNWIVDQVVTNDSSEIKAKGVSPMQVIGAVPAEDSLIVIDNVRNIWVVDSEGNVRQRVVDTPNEEGVVYDHFITHEDVWLRKKDDPGTFIAPTQKAIFGTQVALLEELEVNGKKVAKLKIKSSGDTIFVTNNSEYLSKVEKVVKELEYKMKIDFKALKLPYGTEKTSKVYKKDSTFIAHKKCGDYVMVKGEGKDAIEGYWISKEAAIATKPEFEVKTDDLAKVFSETDKETIQEVVDLVNKYSNEFGITNKERMTHFLAQIGHETGGFEDLEESCSYSKTNSQLKSFSRYYTSDRKSIALTEDSEEKSTLKQIQNPDILKDLTKETIWYFNDDRSKIHKIVNEKSDQEYTYETQYNSGEGIKTKYVGNKVPKCPLFDYVYCCGKANLGNGDVASKDGSRFRGRGYIHLTGKYNYNKDFYKPWKEEYPDDQRTLNELVDLLRTDKDLAMKVAMLFWKSKGLNEVADNPNDLSDDKIAKEVTKVINSGLKGLSDRQQYFKNLNNNL